MDSWVTKYHYQRKGHGKGSPRDWREQTENGFTEAAAPENIPEMMLGKG